MRPQKRERALTECVSSWIERAVLSGDQALISAAVPETRKALAVYPVLLLQVSLGMLAIVSA